MKQGHAEKTVFRPKTDFTAHGHDPGAVSQIGEVVGKNPVKDGAPTLAQAKSSQAEGPGGGRTIHKTGSQGKHGG